jgi:hypothetical protein
MKTAIRQATIAAAAPNGSSVRQRLDRRFKAGFCSTSIFSSNNCEVVSSGRALESQARNACLSFSYLARTNRHRGQPSA